jgi:hypothetical protein
MARSKLSERAQPRQEGGVRARDEKAGGYMPFVGRKGSEAVIVTPFIKTLFDVKVPCVLIAADFTTPFFCYSKD